MADNAPKVITMIVPLHGISTGARGIEVATTGFKGTACTDATKAVLALLGTVQADSPTSEMYDTEERHEYLSGGDGSGG